MRVAHRLLRWSGGTFCGTVYSTKTVTSPQSYVASDPRHKVQVPDNILAGQVRQVCFDRCLYMRAGSYYEFGYKSLKLSGSVWLVE